MKSSIIATFSVTLFIFFHPVSSKEQLDINAVSQLLRVSVVADCNGNNGIPISDSTLKKNCKVEIKCHYTHIPKVNIWNVEIDGAEFHKPFREDATESEVFQNAKDGCKADLLYSDRWIDGFEKECE